MSNKLSGTLTLRLPSGDNRFKAFFNVGESGFATEEYVKQQIAESEKKEEEECVKKTDIQDTLTSIDADKPLSAQQGKILKELLDSKVIEVGAVPMDSKPTEGNIDNVVTSDGLAKEFNKYNTEIVLGGVYDVSAHNNGAVFESLQALLSNSNLSTLIPISIRHGSMTIRFIQGSEQNANNKYVQYRLMATSFSTTPSDWQGVDDVPIAGSDNLVKSGGVANAIETETARATAAEQAVSNKLSNLSDNQQLLLEETLGLMLSSSLLNTYIPISIKKDNLYKIVTQVSAQTNVVFSVTDKYEESTNLSVLVKNGETIFKADKDYSGVWLQNYVLKANIYNLDGIKEATNNNVVKINYIDNERYHSQDKLLLSSGTLNKALPINIQKGKTYTFSFQNIGQNDYSVYLTKTEEWNSDTLIIRTSKEVTKTFFDDYRYLFISGDRIAGLNKVFLSVFEVNTTKENNGKIYEKTFINPVLNKPYPFTLKKGKYSLSVTNSENVSLILSKTETFDAGTNFKIAEYITGDKEINFTIDEDYGYLWFSGGTNVEKVSVKTLYLDERILSSDVSVEDFENLFSASTVKSGYSYESNGTSEIENSSYYISDCKIPAKEGWYSVSNKNGKSISVFGFLYGLYGEDDNLIVSYSVNSASYTQGFIISKDMIKLGVAYIKLSFNNAVNQNDVAVVYGGMRFGVQDRIFGNIIKMSDFRREVNDTSDDNRIAAALKIARYGKTVLFDEKEYLVKSSIIVSYQQCIKMSEMTIVKATDDFSDDYYDNVILYVNNSLYPSSRKNKNISNIPDYKGGYSLPNERQQVTGGCIDGNGVANCLKVNGYQGFQVSNISFLNPLNYGFNCQGGYEMIVSKCTCRNYIDNTEKVAQLIGFKIGGTDQHISDCTAVDTHVGFSIEGSSDRLSRCHHWCGPVDCQSGKYIPNSISFLIKQLDAILVACYADTSEINYKVESTGDAQLIGCGSFSNTSAFTVNKCTRLYADGKVTVIGGRYISGVSSGGDLKILDGAVPPTCIGVTGLN